MSIMSNRFVKEVKDIEIKMTYVTKNMQTFLGLERRGILLQVAFFAK